MKKTRKNAWGLLPIGIFILLYLGTGIIFEYVLKIEMGFYKVPVVVVFLIALFVASLQARDLSASESIELMGKGAGHRDIMTMILIFLEAGIFVGVIGRESAQSVAYFMLSSLPAQFAVPVLFIVACLVSTSMGTSVGTITLLTPIGVELAATGGFSIPLVIASIIGGAMFGDNLSVISDTTIAACNGQGVEMKDKFRENFKIALPAAIVTLAVIVIISIKSEISPFTIPDYNVIQIIPYLLVLVIAITGILDVFYVLLLGIISGIIIMLITGAATPVDLITNMGTGAAGMFETLVVAILVAAICALVKHNGGFNALLNACFKIFKNKKGGMLGMGIIVSLLDISTANNTVAIVIANPIAKEMSEKYDVSPRRTASLLDTFSCIIQGALPYGAQMLVALAAAATLGYNVSAFEIVPLLFYPMALLISSLVFIFIIPDRRGFKD